MYLSPQDYFFTGNFAAHKPSIETLLEKGSGVINEDCIVIGEKTYGVFDGATSLSPTVFQGNLTGGRLAAEICAAAFSDESLTLSQAAGRATQEIRRKAVASGVDYRRKEQIWSASGAIVRLHGDRFDWCQIGDCHIVAVYSDGSKRLLTEDSGQDLLTLRKWKEIAPGCSGTIMEHLADEIQAVRQTMNSAYGVLNGEVEALDFLKSGCQVLDNVRKILIYSDGLMLPQRNPESQQDLEMFVSLYDKGGLSCIRDYIRGKQLEDIGCRDYPRFKTHDDISAVALSL